MNKELLEKYCKNVCTEEELRSVLEWFKASASTREGQDLLFKFWEEISDDDNNLQINFDFILDKIHHKVNLAQSKKLLSKANQNLIKYKWRRNFTNVLLKAAAMLVLPVLGFGLYTTFKYRSILNSQISVNQSYNEVFSSVDAITKVVLPDSSIVWLNHNSSLKYRATFSGDSRTVDLKGEGYFEVAYNPKAPFIVKTGDIQVKAIGTTFNVMAYPDEYKIETSLINGSVELQRIKPDGKVITLSKMKPTDLVILNRYDYEISNHVVNDDRYYSWKDGKLIFNKEPIGEVVKKLSRWFNVEIKIKDPKLLELTYTATFIHESLPQVMELMALSSPLKYSISDRKETSPGAFSKREVILSYGNNK